jgi:replicative DNA helicase
MAPASRKVSREQQVGDLSEGLKNLARDLEVPVVVLSQINRGPTDRRDPRPTMSDLRESGRIEADADQVLLLHRPDLCGENPDNPVLEIHVAKNRNGRTGATIPLTFQGHYSRAALSWRAL